MFVINMKQIWNINTRHYDKRTFVGGASGFFKEVKGPCGWKDSEKYSCCFYRCHPTWKTRLFPTQKYI